MSRLPLAAFLSFALLGVAGGTARGEERPRVTALRAQGPLRLDGILDEPDWERAPPVGPFRLILVREGEVPSESTDVRVLFTDTHVWFGIRCMNQHAGEVRASFSPRDQILDDDHVAIHLDTYCDRHRAYIFGVNPRGVQIDGILDGSDPDFSWDASWDAETHLDDQGWTAEMAIPLRALRFPEHGSGVWGLWIRRQITKNDEVCSWPLYRLGVAGDIMLQAGDLEGLSGLRGGGGFEAQPYAASTQASVRSFAPGAAGWSNDEHHDFGVDLRYGLTSTLTANLTVNPDYSQVEADALQNDVNQRFPLYFPEKRPFFLEGAETFTTFYRLVYTRRIADPAYGGKVIGKLGRWRLGAIAVRDDGGASMEGIGAGASEATMRPGTFSIGRLAYDLGENQKLGVLLTDHLTDGHEGAIPVGGFAAPSTSHNLVISAEAKFRLMKSLFVNGQLGRSFTQIDTVVGVGPQRHHHFADDLSTLAMDWNDGTRHALVYQDYLGSRFRADAGFFDRVDARDVGYEATVTFRPENRWLHSVEPTANSDLVRSSGGALQERTHSGAVRWSFQQQTFLETRLTRVDEVWLGTEYHRWRCLASASNTRWRPLSFGFDLTLEDGIFYAPTDSASYLGWQESVNAYATARPSPRLTSELSATRTRFLRSRGGDQVYDLWLLGAKTTYQFTRRLYVRLYPQYDTYADHVDADGLIGYVLHPGSVVYLGMNGDFDKIAGVRRATQRSVFLKISYVFQG